MVDEIGQADPQVDADLVALESSAIDFCHHHAVCDVQELRGLQWLACGYSDATYQAKHSKPSSDYEVFKLYASSRD